MRHALVTFTLVAATAARAAACPPPIPIEEQPSQRFAFDVGVWVPIYLVDRYTGVAVGPRLAVWLRRGAWWLGAEGEGGKVWAAPDDAHGAASTTIAGTMGRVGANVRWETRVGALSNGDLDFDLWLQGGVGVHALRWDLGGRLVRPDGLAGLGVTERFGRRHAYGMDLGVIMVIGPGHGGGVPTCAGPCDEPTAPVHADVEIIDQIAFTETW